MSGDPIADYLAELRVGLRTSAARTAEILAEAEDHLRESAAAARQAGHLSEAAAQRAAIEAFGPAKAIIRAHRPSATAFAAAAGLKAWPPLVACLLLSALSGALLLWRETVISGGHSIAPITMRDHLHGDRKVTMFADIGTPHPAQAAAVFGGCVLTGVLLVAGFLLLGRRSRRSGLVLVRLPRGLVPLLAATALVAFGVIEDQILGGNELRWLPSVTGAYELVLGSRYAAVLTGVGCALWALAVVLDDSVEAEGACRARRPPVSAYAVEAFLKACQLLGGYLLLSSLMGGLLLCLGGVPFMPLSGPWQVTAAFGGCVLAGVLLIAGFGAVRQRRRRSGLAPARLPRWLSLLASAIVLLALALAEYKYFAGDVTGTWHETEGIVDLILGSQWAAVLLGGGWALRTLISLVRWVLSSGRGNGEAAAPENTDLATAG